MSMLFPDKGPLLVRVGDAGGSGFLGLGASRGRPDHPILLSPGTHIIQVTQPLMLCQVSGRHKTSVEDAMIRAACHNTLWWAETN